MRSPISPDRSLVTDRLAAFETERRRLFGIAYRMLGTVSDAEDVLQDAFLRWDGADTSEPDSVRAYLSRIVTHLCIDRLRQRSRQSYVGPWLPEPLLTTDDAGAERADLSTGFLLMLEAVPPAERAAFVLREAFDLDYAGIGEILDAKASTCRQWCRRARVRLQSQSTNGETAGTQHRAIFERFLAAVDRGDAEAVVQLLTEDALVYADGGGVVSAALIPVESPPRIAQVLIHLRQKQRASYGAAVTEINGGLGLLGYVDGTLDHVLTGEIRDGRVHRLYVVRNPEKLRHLQTATV